MNCIREKDKYILYPLSSSPHDHPTYIFHRGEVTTPQLHFCVHVLNDEMKKCFPAATAMGTAEELLSRYYRSLASGYQLLLSTASTLPAEGVNVTVDAANGVGSLAVQQFSRIFLSTATNPANLVIECRNISGSGPVNENCGAELVQKTQTRPVISGLRYEEGGEDYLDKVFCSFDGDADRIVFHGFLSDGKWVMMDGDKIAALLSLLIVREVKEVSAANAADYSVAVVQTAYANGASTQFLQRNGIHTMIAKTGVKYLHHKAVLFDVGIYFEANGHGTVIFSERLKRDLERCPPSKAADRLKVRVFAVATL